MTTERYQPPFFERENSRYNIVPTLGTKCPFDILFGSYKTHLLAKGFVVPMVGMIVYRAFSNYNELCTKYHFLSIFSIKVFVLQQRTSCFQIVSIIY